MPLNVNTAHRTQFFHHRHFPTATKTESNPVLVIFSFEHVYWGWVSLKMCFFNAAFSPCRELVPSRPKEEGFDRAPTGGCPFPALFSCLRFLCVASVQPARLRLFLESGFINSNSVCVTHNWHPSSSAEEVPLRKSCLSARTCCYVFTSASKTSNLVL